MSLDTEALPDSVDTTPAPEASPPSLREVIETSMAKATPDNTGAAPEETPKEAAPAPKADKPRDEVGRFAKSQEKAPAAKEPASKLVMPKTEAPKVEAAKPVEGAPKAAEPLKAPQSWKPEAREKWASVAPEVQAEIHRREAETQTLLQRTASERKVAADLRDLVSPYMGMIQAEGSNPMQAIGRLLQTGAALRTAPPAQKAELLGTIAETYGIDLGAVVAVAVRSGKLNVEALDGTIAAALQGQPQRQMQQFDPNSFRREIKQEVMSELRQGSEAAAQEREYAEAQKFMAEHEFANDVRETMADYIDTRRARGLSTTLQQAYDWAIRADEGISKVLQQREAAKSAATASAATQRTRAAASSVKSRPAQPVGGGQPKDLRAALELAMDTQ